MQTKGDFRHALCMRVVMWGRENSWRVGELEFTVEREAIYISNANGLSEKITPNDKRFNNPRVSLSLLA